MKEKKQSKDWYIAATYYLTAGFVIPIIVGLVLGFPAVMLIGLDNIVFLEGTMSAIWVLSIWLGVIYATKYVNKTYIIKNSKNIAKLATVYLSVIVGGSKLFNLFVKGITTGLAVDIVFSVVGVIIFYILSKKYIKNNEQLSTQ